MIQAGLAAAKAQQELLAANRNQQLPPLSARTAETDAQSTKPLSARLKCKLPRTPSVKQLLGDLEAKLNLLALKPQPNSVLEEQCQGCTPKQTILAGRLANTGKLAPAEVQQCLREVSLAFGEVIELLPSYRQLLIRVQETYDNLIMHVLEELRSTANLRSRVRVLSAQLQRLEGNHNLFPAENSWAEACKLRRHLADKDMERQTLEDECRKLQGKVSKQAAHLRELQQTGFKHRRTLANLEETDIRNKLRLADRTRVLAEKRWTNFIEFAMQNMAPSPQYDNDAASEDSGDLPRLSVDNSEQNILALLSPQDRPHNNRMLHRHGSLVRRLSLPPELCVMPPTPLTPPADQPELTRLESTHSVRSNSKSGPLLLDNPSPTMNLADAVHSLVVEHHPEKWGLSMHQLYEFWHDIKDDLEFYCDCHDELERDGERIHICSQEHCAWEHPNVRCEPLSRLSHKEKAKLRPLSPNMHLIVNRYIKPQTEPSGKSYALMKNPRGRKCNIFITHVWTDKFKNFVHTLRRALSENDVVWVCSFAMPQNSSDEIQALLASTDLRDCPFGVALRHAESHVVVLDEDAVVPTRSWCTYEINLGSNLNKPMLLWPHHIHNFEQLHARVELLDMETASASRREDEERIKADIRSMGGFEALNKRLRSLLHDRIRFAQDIVLAGKADREGIMHTFRQALAKEEEDHKKCQLEKAELSHKLQAALDSGNSKLVGEVCRGITGLKLDGNERACWEGIQKLHLMLEYQPLKADKAAVHAMQVMCSTLVRIHRESESLDWGNTFSRAFLSELEGKELVNIQEDVVKFIAQIKPPREFSAVFLPNSCLETWEKFGQRQAQDKADKLVGQQSIETDRKLFRDRLTYIEDRINHEMSIRKSDAFDQQDKVLDVLGDNRRDVMRTLEVIGRTHAHTQLADRAHRDELEKREVASRRAIEELRAQIQELKDSKELAIQKEKFLGRQLAAETVDQKILELTEEMSRTTENRDETRTKLEEAQKQQRRLECEVQIKCRENEEMKEEFRKNELLVKHWEKEAKRLQSELSEQTAISKKLNFTMLEYKFEKDRLALKPAEQAKTPSAAMRILCKALVMAADEEFGLRKGWYETFQDFFKKALKEIPAQKEHIEHFICDHGGPEFQLRYMSYRTGSGRRSSRRRMKTMKSKENLGQKTEDPLQDLEILSDWEEEDRPATAPDLTRPQDKSMSRRNVQANGVTVPITRTRTSRIN